MKPTRTRTSRIWLGVGVAALVTTGASADDGAAGPAGPQRQAQAAPSSGGSYKSAEAAAAVTNMHVHGAAAKPYGQGGEGGEGGGEAGGGGRLAANVRFLRDLGLIRGHLLVGNELVEQDRWADGLPHFLHPIEEIYEALRGPLRDRHTADFDGALKALAQTVKAKRAEAYAQAWSRVDEKLTAVEAAERSSEGAAWPTTEVKVALALLQSATGEYEGAIEDGRITRPIEYQDSRGFVYYAGLMLDKVAGDLKGMDGGAYASMRKVHDVLKTAWPTAVPPEKPVLDHGAVLAMVSRFELAAGPFLKH